MVTGNGVIFFSGVTIRKLPMLMQTAIIKLGESHQYKKGRHQIIKKDFGEEGFDRRGNGVKEGNREENYQNSLHACMTLSKQLKVVSSICEIYGTYCMSIKF